jgi:hypothetical protein
MRSACGDADNATESWNRGRIRSVGVRVIAYLAKEVVAPTLNGADRSQCTGMISAGRDRNGIAYAVHPDRR